MKKLLTLTVMATLAVSAQAATINWANASGTALRDPSNNKIKSSVADGIGLAVYFINETYLETLMGGTMERSDLLVILGSGSSIDSYAMQKLSGASAISPTTPLYDGVLAGASVGFTYDGNSAANKAKTGDQFFVLVVADFGTGKVYQFWDSAAWVSAIDTDGGAGVDSQSFAWTAATNTTPGGGWQPIPEPLTVGLALAGVALLIAQRKRK